jgi:hypothetical protein
MQYEPLEAMDCLRMLSTLVSFEDKRANAESVINVQQWIAENSIHKDGCFHGYLISKEKVLMQSAGIIFFQKRLSSAVSKANKLLDTGWEINLPENAQELATIGDMQRHCVGTRFYAERCVDGSNIIFQIMPKGNMRNGYTFQYSRSGSLLQAKGYANSGVPANMQKKSKSIFMLLMADLVDG